MASALPNTVQDMTNWRNSRIAFMLVVGVFLAIQLIVPISRSAQDNPQRFGWQMFSAIDPAPEFVVTTSDGATTIEIEDYMAAVRVEIDVERYLPPHLCSVIPDAIEVTWEKGTHQC